MKYRIQYNASVRMYFLWLNYTQPNAFIMHASETLEAMSEYLKKGLGA